MALLRQPAMRRRLELELADAQQALPRPLLTYEQLLSFFISITCACAMMAVIGARPPSSAQLAASRAAHELLPKLAPDNPRFLIPAAAATLHTSRMTNRYYPMIRSALRVAEEQGNDFYIADCAYGLAGQVIKDRGSAVPQDRPSTVLRWLEQGEAAHRRCKSVLPKQWSFPLTSKKMLALVVKPWLQQLQRDGDRWRPHPPELGSQFCLLFQRQFLDFDDTPTALSSVTAVAKRLRSCAGAAAAWRCSTAGEQRDLKAAVSISFVSQLPVPSAPVLD